MLSKIVKTVFGSRNDRIIKKLKQRVLQINQLEASMQALDDEQLRQKTAEFRQRFGSLLFLPFSSGPSNLHENEAELGGSRTRPLRPRYSCVSHVITLLFSC